MSTTQPKPPTTPALYRPPYFTQENRLGTPAQQAAADALIRARNAAQASAARAKRAAELHRQITEAAATSEAHLNEACREHAKNLDRQRTAYHAATLAKARPTDLPEYYEAKDSTGSEDEG